MRLGSATETSNDPATDAARIVPALKCPESELAQYGRTLEVLGRDRLDTGASLQVLANAEVFPHSPVLNQDCCYSRRQTLRHQVRNLRIYDGQVYGPNLEL